MCLGLCLNLRSQPRFSGPDFAAWIGFREVFRSEHLANLDIPFVVVRIQAALEPFERLVHRFHVPQPEARDQLLRLGERPIGHRAQFAGEMNPLAFRAGIETFAGEHNPNFEKFFVELAHLAKQLLAGHDTGLGLLTGFDNEHDFYERTCVIKD
jgi:hypothetical protein